MMFTQASPRGKTTFARDANWTMELQTNAQRMETKVESATDSTTGHDFVRPDEVVVVYSRCDVGAPVVLRQIALLSCVLFQVVGGWGFLLPTNAHQQLTLYVLSWQAAILENIFGSFASVECDYYYGN